MCLVRQVGESGGCVMARAKTQSFETKIFGSKMKRNLSRCRIQPMIGSKAFKKWLYKAPQNSLHHTTSPLTILEGGASGRLRSSGSAQFQSVRTPEVSEVRNPE